MRGPSVPLSPPWLRSQSGHSCGNHPALSPRHRPRPPLMRPRRRPAQSGSILARSTSPAPPPCGPGRAARRGLHGYAPDVRVAVQGGGSSTGVKSAGEATVDIGMASREVKESELAEFPGLQIHVVARDGIAVVANPGVPVDNLTPEQVREIFAGNITNWSEVAGPDEEIVVVAREEGSGTRAAFEEMIKARTLITDTAVLQPQRCHTPTVASTPNSTVSSLGYLTRPPRPCR